MGFFMNKILLITRPDHDITTRYLSAWKKKVVDLAERKNIRVLDLKRAKANKKEFEGRLKKVQPSFVILNGHGDEDCVTGYDNEILVQAGKNEDILKSKIVYAVSCKSAKELGSKSVKAGAIAYVGYANDFIFCHSFEKITRPLEDKLAGLFLEPSNQVAASIIKGNTCGKATENSKRYFFRNIQKMMSSEASVEFSQYVKFLWWDMKYQICLGNKNATF